MASTGDIESIDSNKKTEIFFVKINGGKFSG